MGSPAMVKVAVLVLWTGFAFAAGITREFTVSESQPVGYIVGYLSEKPVSAPSGNRLYQVHYSPDASSKFLVDERSGEVRLIEKLDYEVKQSYTFIAVSFVDSSAIQVSVKVQDENDNGPRFPAKRITKDVSEIKSGSYPISLPFATDRDVSLRYGVQRYEIESGNVNNAFRLESKRINENLFVDLVVNSDLDRERIDRYELVIVAYDGGSPPLTDKLTVDVNILDANDNPPRFVGAPYKVTINSSLPIGQTFLRVAANDTDADQNGQVRYSLLNSPRDSQRLFQIDALTGELSLKASIGQYVQPSYSLLVLARDMGAQPLESSTTVTVQVAGNAESQLRFDVRFLTQDSRPFIPEDAANGTRIARIRLENSLTGNGVESKMMKIDNPVRFFSLLPTDKSDTYALVTSDLLDREYQANYTLTLSGSTPNGEHVTKNITVHLSDVNDNKPQFAKLEYQAEIKERSPPGTSVREAVATDLDEGENGKVEYSLSAADQTYDDWFKIDPETGVIVTNQRVDCEVSAQPILTVTATDRGEPRRSSTARVLVNVKDINDYEPVFERSVYNETLSEDTKPGTCFLEVRADDPDCGVNSNVHYEIEDAVMRELFTLHSSGRMCLAKQLDYEEKTSYQFTIKARDGGGLSGSAQVHLQLLDANDNVPYFYPQQYNLSLRADMAIGRPVLTVSAHDQDAGPNGRLRYEVTSGNEWGTFRLQEDTGQLYIAQRLTTDSYLLKIEASDSGGLTSEMPALVSISVIPGEINAPVFVDTPYIFTVREDMLPDITVGSVKAQSYGLIRYHIYAGDPEGKFKIEAETGAISLAKFLDRDRTASILLNVQVSAGEPLVYNHTQVRIIVEDINDNSPVFDSSQVTLTVSESTDLDVPIYAARATDADDPAHNGLVKYRLVKNPGGRFLLNPDSGEISLLKSLDYEAEKKFVLEIEAFDGGIPSRTDRQMLTILVGDANDNSPRFDTPIYHASISEAAPPLTSLVTLHASDADAGMNAELSYEIVGPEGDLETFGIYGNTGQVYVRRQLDRETQDSYRLLLRVRDSGSPSRSDNASLIIRVLDDNDHAPKCPENAVFKIDEGKPENTLIGTFEAPDPDLASNGTVFYWLEKPSTIFQIDSSSGKLSALKSLDYESIREYELTIVAKDGGRPARSSQCPVVIQVQDANDNAPFFVLPHVLPVMVNEEMPAGSEVTQVRATDQDKGANGTVRYSIVGRPSNHPFEIHAETGVVTTTRVLDYERDERYYALTVLAEDTGFPVMSTMKVITFELSNVDDGPPLLQNATVMTFDISEGVPPGTNVGNIIPRVPGEPRSLDEDFSFDIVSGNTMNWFGVDSGGMLHTLREIDFETLSLVVLRVKITDKTAYRSTWGASKVVMLKIYIKDENDNEPIFANDDPSMFYVSEGSPVDQVVFTFNATDKDSGSNGRVAYSIEMQMPREAFSIDEITGQLKVSQPIDYEEVKNFLLIIRATDQGMNIRKRRSSQLTARVIVTDVNDNAPQFHTENKLTIRDTNPVLIFASDPDWEENGKVSYRILSGNEQGIFSLNGSSGVLKMLKRPQSTDAATYKLEIMASDNGKPSRYTSQYFFVTIPQSQMFGPRFSQTTYEATIAENAPPNTFVKQLTAKRQDGKGILSYQIGQGEGDGEFEINERSGVIQTKRTLDREKKAAYLLAVTVVDTTDPEFLDTTLLTIHVTDVNDNSPKVSASSLCNERQPVSLLEATKHQGFHRILAFDADDGENGDISYSLAGGNVDGKFKIDPSSGLLSSEKLDRESVTNYNLTILARDNGVPGLTNGCHLLVTVMDTNDEVPVFKEQNWHIQIREDHPIDMPIERIVATDADAGLNGQVTYQLINNTGAFFDIDENTGELKLRRAIDYETAKQHVLTVKATDSGEAVAHSATASIIVNVLDVNDNGPRFSEEVYEGNISFSVQPGQRIIKVEANDPDDGQNGKIIFEQADNFPSKFVIRGDTGVISAKESLFGMSTSDSPIVFKVRASDLGQPQSLSTYAIVKLYIQEDHQPQFLSFLQKDYRIKLREGTPNGSPLVTVLAEWDGSRSGPVEYQILPGQDAPTIAINSQSGEVVIANTSLLDYERKANYRILLKAKGANDLAVNHRAESYATLHVELIDSNDNAPLFLQTVYSAFVPEGLDRGAFVTQVTATDLDTEENEGLSYSIVGGNQDGAFSIDTLGAIRTTTVLDREISNSYDLQVMASDAQLSGQATVRVRVLDVNDNEPAVKKDERVELWEDQPLGAPFHTVIATDTDLVGTMTFDFTPDSNPEGAFAIGRYNGQISLRKRLDYEYQKEHDLKIKVSDGQQQSIATRRIIVKDVNDNPPRFIEPVYKVKVPESNPGGGRRVAVIAATDADSGVNGEVRYAIASSEPAEGGFWIDHRTGDLYCNGSEAFYRSKSVTLVVRATDTGDPPLSSQVTVHVQIVPTQHSMLPAFAKNAYQFSVSEGVPVQYVIGKLALLSAPDAEDIEFAITAGDYKNQFKIDNSGQITVIRPLDREVLEEYRLEVTVRSKSDGVTNSSATVFVKIEDVNDNPPEFITDTGENRYRATISEDLPIGSPVKEVVAKDKDAGPNGEVEYNITSGNQNEIFAIDPQNGRIFLKKRADYETRRDFKLVVTATDHGQPTPLSALITVDVSVTNENDNAPKFPRLEYSVRVRENADPQSLITITANDQDQGRQGDIIYSIRDDYPEIKDNFEINSITGDIRSKSKFDYESRTSFEFTVVASNQDGQSGTAKLTVLVTGEDEFAPVFLHTPYLFRASFGSESGDIIGQIFTHDDDDGPDGKVTYRFEKPDRHFGIHNSTGVITVLESLSTLSESNDDIDLTKHRKRRQTANEDATRNMYLRVIAQSGTSARPMSSSTRVHIELGHFEPRHLKNVIFTAPIVSTISVVLILLILAVVVFIAVRLKRNNGKQSPDRKSPLSDMSAHRLSPARSHHTHLTESTLERNGFPKTSLSLVRTAAPAPPPTYADAMPQPQPQHTHLRPPLPQQGGGSRGKLHSIASTLSPTKSTGRDSAFPPEGDDVWQPMPGRGHNRLRSAPDSGIHVMPDDVASLASGEYPSTQEYLTSLGVVCDPPTNRASTSSNDVQHIMHSSAALESENDPELHNILYAKLSEVETDDGIADIRLASAMPPTDRSSVAPPTIDPAYDPNIHSLENVPPNWGPSYQPLSHVFSEIAKLKDSQDTLKKRHTQARSRFPPEIQGRPSPTTFMPNFASPNETPLPPPNGENLHESSPYYSTAATMRKPMQEKEIKI